MSVLGIGAVGTALKGAAEMVRELRRPTLKSEDFATVLRARMEHQSQPDAQNVFAAQLRESGLQGAKFMQVRDANADGMLSMEESALAQELFNKLDIDQNGKLSVEEVQAGYLAGMTGNGPAMPVQEME